MRNSFLGYCSSTSLWKMLVRSVSNLGGAIITSSRSPGHNYSQSQDTKSHAYRVKSCSKYINLVQVLNDQLTWQMKCSIGQISGYAESSDFSRLFNEIYLKKMVAMTFRRLAVPHAVMTGNSSYSHATWACELNEKLLSTLERQITKSDPNNTQLTTSQYHTITTHVSLEQCHHETCHSHSARPRKWKTFVKDKALEQKTFLRCENRCSAGFLG